MTTMASASGLNVQPRNSGAQLLIFWDYDTQWGADRSRLPGGVKGWGHLEFECTDRLLDLHATYDIASCFAVVGSAALPGARPYHDPSQVRRIHAAGHEVASHSHRHEWLPALGPAALRETLRSSREALEDCIGGPVRTFVPPFNQPFDYLRRGAISISERRSVRGSRTDISRLCRALAETGYRVCRLAYRPLVERVAEWWGGERRRSRGGVEQAYGMTCLRLNTGGGFDASAVAVLDRCVEHGGVTVAYGHPHSLSSGNSQDERHLVPFFERVCRYRQQGQLQVLRPAELVGG